MEPYLESPPQFNAMPADSFQVQPNSPEAAMLTQLGASTQKRIQNSCITFLLMIIGLALFFVFGGRIFSFFNISNVYDFIISLIIIIIVYIIGVGIVGIFIKYPRDLLNIVSERLRVN